MMSRGSGHVIRRYYDALNERNFEALGEIVAAGFFVDNSGFPLDLAAFRSMRQNYVIGFPDLHHKIREVIQEGCRLAVLTETTGTHLGPFLGHAPTAQSFRADGIDLVQIDKDKLSRVFSVFD